MKYADLKNFLRTFKNAKINIFEIPSGAKILTHGKTNVRVSFFEGSYFIVCTDSKNLYVTKANVGTKKFRLIQEFLNV
jgi:hypothetical protein